MATPLSQSTPPLEQVRAAIEHIHHVLSGQGPILDFVHENTLEGFQHLPFRKALAEHEALTGIRGYMKESRFRDNYRTGRITDTDLEKAIQTLSALTPDKLLADNIKTGDIYAVALKYPLHALTSAQLQWQLGRERALEAWQQDVPGIYQRNDSPAETLPVLWSHILTTLGIDPTIPEPDDITPDDHPGSGRLTEEASICVENLLADVGELLSLGGLVKRLVGKDILDDVGPIMLRLSATALDEGTAAWHLGDNHHTSLFKAWRSSLLQDHGFTIEDLPLKTELATLPDEPEAAIIHQLEEQRLPREIWGPYLQRLCLEIPGWTGLINWRQRHPGYHCVNPLQPHLRDWLAIRLTLDKLYLQKICRETWRCHGDFFAISEYLRNNSAECLVRYHWLGTHLPEALGQQIASLAASGRSTAADWENMAMAVMRSTDEADVYHAHNQGWRLFRLCQHLNLGQKALPALTRNAMESMLEILRDFDLSVRSEVWLLAYEIHYRDELFQGILSNYRRGHWVNRGDRAQAQIVMCMDEREESFRRHLEEINPRIETLGAAGFFGVPIKYKALDDTHLTPLCPVVVTPAHRVSEVARDESDPALASHRKGFAFLFGFAYQLHQGFRINPLLNWVGTFLLAPFSLPGQLMHSLLPDAYKHLVDKLRGYFLVKVRTSLTVTTDTPEQETSIENPRLGFTDAEQAQKVGALLRTLGLTDHFAPLVALSGHGSTSQNNPHEAAHDCGACGGRQGGPNARTYAAMINRPEVRELLAKEGIHIPPDTWFLGLQHDTCSDALTWYDTDLIPANLREAFAAFRSDMEQAQACSAHERCRRFYSAGEPATPEQGFRHVTLRSRDLSQVRPEYGHATNASAVIGRRDLTQGLFLDRRTFLISYDPTQDADGKILENILLTAGPVGAGINLEYYFSTIDNDKYGCGTKIPHNVAGLFGVMEGTGSDLRPGLPEQMVEIHEPMRLLVIVEHKTTVLARIYGDQPALQELIGGGWLLLAVKDPDSEAIYMFDPDKGFVPWQEAGKTLAEFDHSMDCYAHSHVPIGPALIRRPQPAGAR